MINIQVSRERIKRSFLASLVFLINQSNTFLSIHYAIFALPDEQSQLASSQKKPELIL